MTQGLLPVIGYGAAMAAQLDITESDPGHIALVGELDTHTAPQLVQYLGDMAPETAISLDLEATTFISSAGLSAILNAQRRHVEHGGSLVVTAADANVARTIELSGLAEVLGLSGRDENS